MPDHKSESITDLIDKLPDYEKLHLTIQIIKSQYRVGYMGDHGFWESPKNNGLRTWFQAKSLIAALTELYKEIIG